MSGAHGQYDVRAACVSAMTTHKGKARKRRAPLVKPRKPQRELRGDKWNTLPHDRQIDLMVNVIDSIFERRAARKAARRMLAQQRRTDAATGRVKALSETERRMWIDRNVANMTGRAQYGKLHTLRREALDMYDT